MTDMKTKRTYTMGARAQAVEETRRRIIQATFDLQTERLTAEIGLDAVAERAGVSVQTVLRQFGNRAALFDVAVTVANERIMEERRTPVGDVPAAVRTIVDHYEAHGDFALLMLAQENHYDHIRRMSEAGKATHRLWVEEVFAPYARDDPALVDLLVVATDVYTWKLLRRDRGLSRTVTEHRMKDLVAAVLATAKTKET